VESTDRVIVTRVNDLKYSRKSQFQQIDIFDTPSFGLCLALDGLIQISQADEALYHEFFIHPACVLNPDATSAVILGGGDGCAAREILKYRNMSTIEMVEIDPLVIDACREHFKSVNAGAMDNPRLKIIVDDAVKYLKEDQSRKFDLIFADLTEPYDLSGVAGDLSRDFFSASFYDNVKARMSPEGILTVQTGGIANIPELDTFHYSIIDGLCQSFKTVYTAYIHVHSFVQCWSITLASDYPYKIDELDPVPVMERLGITGLKYYNRVSHQKAFWKANP
jgi:spermidine synthase